MGQMVAVTCPRCGCHEPHLSGVGGQWGMLARLVTATCTQAERLVDED